MLDNLLDKRHFSILEYIYEHPYISYGDLKLSFSSYADIEDVLQFLYCRKLISCRIADSPDSDVYGYETSGFENSSHLIALPSGNAIIEDKYERATEISNQLKPLQDLVDEMSSLAKSAKIQADLAIQSAKRAEQDAKKAHREAIFSKILAVLSLFVALLSPFLAEYARQITEEFLKLLKTLG